jgi:hypothetical protein
MFALGSSSEGTAPPREWEGLDMLEEVPAGGPTGVGLERKAEQLTAPAGTAILYDCRTWHRQHANLSHAPRSCLLSIFTPRWILPAHGDQTEMCAAMLSAAGVTSREREHVTHLIGDRYASASKWPVVTPILPPPLLPPPPPHHHHHHHHSLPLPTEQAGENDADEAKVSAGRGAIGGTATSTSKL